LGKKNVEVRVNDEKRRRMKIGDEIVFLKRPDNIEKIVAKISNLNVFNNFNELYRAFNNISLGYNDNEEKDPKDMEEYYTKEEQKKYGVVAFKLKLVKDKAHSSISINTNR
jgi:ASC-1-like (ASCH) protein